MMCARESTASYPLSGLQAGVPGALKQHQHIASSSLLWENAVTKTSLRNSSLFLVYGSREVESVMAGRCDMVTGSGSCCSHFHPQAGSRKREQEMDPSRLETLKALPTVMNFFQQSCASPKQGHQLKTSHTMWAYRRHCTFKPQLQIKDCRLLEPYSFSFTQTIHF